MRTHRTARSMHAQDKRYAGRFSGPRCADPAPAFNALPLFNVLATLVVVTVLAALIQYLH